MIYNHKLNTIIWLPYKNYSSSLMDYFNAHEWRNYFEATDWTCHYSNSIKMNLPGYDDIGATRHGITYPPMIHAESNSFEWQPRDCKSYRRLLPLRNPYDRVLSMWKFHIDYNKEQDLQEPDSLTYYMTEVFMFHPLTLPATRLFRHHYQWTMKMENIEEELVRHKLMLPDPKGFRNKPFPLVNKSRYTLEEVMDDDTRKLWEEKFKPMVAHFHIRDFEAGDYEI